MAWDHTIPMGHVSGPVLGLERGGGTPTNPPPLMVIDTYGPYPLGRFAGTKRSSSKILKKIIILKYFSIKVTENTTPWGDKKKQPGLAAGLAAIRRAPLVAGRLTAEDLGAQKCESSATGNTWNQLHKNQAQSFEWGDGPTN